MPKVLTNGAERARRLLCVMSAWWGGEKVTAIAQEHRVSRQLIYRLLTSTRCNWRLRRRKRVSRYADPSWRPPADDVAKARTAVEHPAFHRLTTQQRGALAWRALSLNLPEISEHMGCYPSATRDILMTAHWRMEQAIHGPTRKVTPDPLPEFDMTDIEDLLRPK